MLGREGRRAEPLREREAGPVTERQALGGRLGEQRCGSERVGVGEGLHGELLADRAQLVGYARVSTGVPKAL